MLTTRFVSCRASFPSFSLPLSYGCGEEIKKNVRFARPLVKETEETVQLSTPKKGKTRKLVRGALGAVKMKMLCCGHF